MGIKTGIEWCDSTCNVMAGCKGCELHPEHCYAKAWCDRWSVRKGYPAKFEEPELFFYRLDEAVAWSDLSGMDRPNKPWLNGMPRVIFLNDLGDTFTPGLDWKWFGPVVERIAASRHIWIVLTKWPKRFREFVEWYVSRGIYENDSTTATSWPRLPSNLWGGVSVTSQKTAPRIEDLLKIPLAKRIVSVEPMLGPVDFPLGDEIEELERREIGMRGCGMGMFGQSIDWVIFGGESGRSARPCDVEWIRHGIRQCRQADVPVFVKQLGANAAVERPPEAKQMVAHGAAYRIEGGRWKVVCRDSKGGDPSEWPEDLRVRQMPSVSV